MANWLPWVIAGIALVVAADFFSAKIDGVIERLERTISLLRDLNQRLDKIDDDVSSAKLTLGQLHSPGGDEEE